MVLSYNSRLKPISEKGKCGDPEICESEDVLMQKINQLRELIMRSKHTVVFTGAGISTSCGIADFRGPTGVWTNELRGITLNPDEDTSDCFDKAIPSFCHRSLYTLLEQSKIHHIISQNVDGLHMRSGVTSDAWLTELHGNIFIEECVVCGSRYLRGHDVGGMGLRFTGNKCDDPSCSGMLIDNAVDWDTDLPEYKFKVAEEHLSKANLVICLGTSLRIRPAGNMPNRVLRKSSTRDVSSGFELGNLVIVNLQSTHLDKKATIKINGYCDEVMKKLCESLGVEVADRDPIVTCTLPPSKRPRKRSRRKAVIDQPTQDEKMDDNTSSSDGASRRSSRLASGNYWRSSDLYEIYSED